MNFLAHLQLSGSNQRVKIGNFMGDGIRGKDYENFSNDIKIGVLLHREIDTFTDAHDVFRKSKRRFSHKYNHFSGVITDMIYDHFLSKNWENYSSIPLRDFTFDFYQSLDIYYDELNEKTKNILPYLKKQDWLYNYQFIDHLEIILGQMDNRFKGKSIMRESVVELQKDYRLFEDEFSVFYQDLSKFALNKRFELEKKYSL